MARAKAFGFMLVAAGLAVAVRPAAAQTAITGFQINKIEGTGHLTGLLDDRLTEDFKVNLDDCLLYLAGSSPAKPDSEGSDLSSWSDLSEQEHYSDVGGKADHIGDNVPRVVVKWSLTPVTGYSYSIKVGSCSETGGIDDDHANDSACRYVDGHRNQDLTSYTNNEINIDLRELIGADECASGDVGENGLYFFIQWSDDTFTKQVSVVKFKRDFEPPIAPEALELEPGENNIRASWEDDVNAGDITYNVYYSKTEFDDDSRDQAEVKVGNTSKSLQIADLELGAVYYIGVTAVDDFDNESNLSEVLTETPISVDDFWETYKKSGGGEEGGFCFVATAAWGSPMEGSVVLLRAFRDSVLLTSPWGRSFVRLYYLHGPGLAAFIHDKPVLRFAARVALLPAVALAWFTVAASQLARVVLLLALGTLFLLAVQMRRAIACQAQLHASSIQPPHRSKSIPRLVATALRSGQEIANRKSQIGTTIALFLLFFSSSTLAEDTPRTLALEFRAGQYQPGIDSEFEGATPYQKIFKDDSAWIWGIELDSQVFQAFGSIGIFGSAGWGYVTGKGLAQDGNPSSDETTLSLAPLVLGGAYRFDVLAERWGVPLVPVVKGGLNYTVWWVRDGLGEVSTFKQGDKEFEGAGGTFGLYYSASLHLLLDFFEPHTAKVFDNDMGVNNSYAFIEFARFTTDDFGSDKSLDLSDDSVIFGLAFEM